MVTAKWLPQGGGVISQGPGHLCPLVPCAPTPTGPGWLWAPVHGPGLCSGLSLFLTPLLAWPACLCKTVSLEAATFLEKWGSSQTGSPQPSWPTARMEPTHPASEDIPKLVVETGNTSLELGAIRAPESYREGERAREERPPGLGEAPPLPTAGPRPHRSPSEALGLGHQASRAKGSGRLSPWLDRAGGPGQDREAQGCQGTPLAPRQGRVQVARHSLKLRAGPGSGARSQTRGSRTELEVRSRVSRLSSSRKRRKVK